jgi:hypothetical protein
MQHMLGVGRDASALKQQMMRHDALTNTVFTTMVERPSDVSNVDMNKIFNTGRPEKLKILRVRVWSFSCRFSLATQPFQKIVVSSKSRSSAARIPA